VSSSTFAAIRNYCDVQLPAHGEAFSPAMPLSIGDCFALKCGSGFEPSDAIYTCQPGNAITGEVSSIPSCKGALIGTVCAQHNTLLVSNLRIYFSLART